MKRINSILILLVVVCISLCSCTKSSSAETETIVGEPDISEIRSICKLATMECYYNNVAKSVKEKGSGLPHVLEKDRRFWMEYTGKAKIGVDMSKGSMDIDGTHITIFLPEAEIMNIRVISTSVSDTIVSSDAWFNKNPITADDQTKAIDDAQNDMENDIYNNTALLADAQERAKNLIKNYINKLGEASGVEYTVTWENVEIERNDIEQEVE